MGKIRTAIVGVGNCASALVQGVSYYRAVKDQAVVPGLMHTVFGGYRVRDVEFVAAFDVNRLKIGRDLGEAIFTEPNSCVRFAKVPKLGVEVVPGPISDGVAPHMIEPFKAYSENPHSSAREILREADAEVLVNFLPVGSRDATRLYAEACLDAGVAFINAIPEFIASDPAWSVRFERAGLPVAGDDIKSQVGATILHRRIIDLLLSRGVKVEETYQLNVGGNTDFLNMTVEERLKTKRTSKTEAVTSLVPYELPTRIGPSEYIPFLGDKKIAHIYARGRKFGDQPIIIDVKLQVEDSPTSAGVVIDAIRAVKIALDRGVSGPLESVSAYFFKHPPVNVQDDLAYRWVEEFITGERER